MRLAKILLLSASVLALTGAYAGDASACGGCFVQQSESTQVTGHRMILSTSAQSTTLWDQIKYSGNPAEFAWVLPIKGTVDIDLSSDALFEALEQYTQVTVASPQITCPPPPDCYGAVPSAGGEDGTGSGGGGGGGVEVIASEVVGPFETVQLASDDPAALANWLASHNYNVPDEIAPIIAAYVNEDFNFLALKLVPGEGIDSMRPVRVTTQGASPVLPLRMVAAGTGAVTPITLWVMGEGRYAPANFPSFTIDQSQLVWDWTSQSSNYKALRASGFDSTGGLGWLTEAGEPFASYDLEYVLSNLAQYDPAGSGYQNEDGTGALENANADVAALFAGIDRGAVWVNRMYGELPRVALGEDLELAASADQTPVQRYFQTTESVGEPPACPEYPPCDSGSYSTGAGAGFPGEVDGSGGDSAGADNEVIEVNGGSCSAAGGSAGSSAFAGAGLVLALSFLRRRRARS